jgi:hypothetical protein
MTPHSVVTFCLPRNLLFIYPKTTEISFCLPSYYIIVLFYYRCIVLKILCVYLLKTTFYLPPRITCCHFYGRLRHLFVYILKTTFYLPQQIKCCLFLWTTSTYSPFQHITIDYICHTHRLLIIMAKTNRTNPHSEEPTRRSNQTAGKSPASVDLPARKPTAARKATSALKDTAACKDTAASPSHGDSKKFSDEHKGPPEAIVPAPEAIV